MNKLKEIRLKKGLKVNEACKLIGISACYLSQLETEQRQISSSMLKKICKGYNIKPNELLGYDDVIILDNETNEFTQQDIEIMRLIKQLTESDRAEIYNFLSFLIFKHQQRIEELENGKKGN